MLLFIRYNKTERFIKGLYNQGVNINRQRAEMPTPYEFMAFVKYLIQGNVKGLKEAERISILDDILKRGKYRGNHLNARFVKRSGLNFVKRSGFNGLDIETHAFDYSGKAIKKIAPLEQCLWEDCYGDLSSVNGQGLLTKEYSNQSYEQGKNLYFYYPRENYVARLSVLSLRAGLLCYWLPVYSVSSLGVRLVIRPKGARKN